jgi:hypothetical protein
MRLAQVQRAQDRRQAEGQEARAANRAVLQAEMLGYLVSMHTDQQMVQLDIGDAASGST